MRWRLYIEEYAPDLQYIPGPKNIVADALSRLDIQYEPMPEAQFTEELESYLYCYDNEDLRPEAFPLTYEKIGKEQVKDEALKTKLTSKKPGYNIKDFQYAG